MEFFKTYSSSSEDNGVAIHYLEMDKIKLKETSIYPAFPL